MQKNNLARFTDHICQLPIKVGSISKGQSNFLTSFLKAHPEIQTVLETGFNVGLSAAVMMNANPNLTITSFDIFWFDCTRRAKLLLDIYFPKRHTLIAGNSINTLPTFFSQHPTYHPDLVFIDGGHEDPIPLLDLYYILKQVKPGTWVIIDDYCKAHGMSGVIKGVNFFITNKILCEIEYMSDDTDRGWVVAKRSEEPIPDVPMAHDDDEIECLLRDTESHYP